MGDTSARALTQIDAPADLPLIGEWTVVDSQAIPFRVGLLKDGTLLAGLEDTAIQTWGYRTDGSRVQAQGPLLSLPALAFEAAGSDFAVTPEDTLLFAANGLEISHSVALSSTPFLAACAPSP